MSYGYAVREKYRDQVSIRFFKELGRLLFKFFSKKFVIFKKQKNIFFKKMVKKV